MTARRASIVTILLALLLTGELYAGYHDEGRRYYTRRQYDKAREMFLKSIESSDMGDSYYFLGEIEKNAGNYAQAEKYFRVALVKKNTTEKYRRNTFWNLIVLTQQREDYEEMCRICLDLWRRTGDQGAREKVENVINRFLWSDNKDAVDLYNQGLEAKKDNRGEDAAAFYRKALAADSSFLAPRFELAMSAYHRDDYNTAAENLRPVVEAIPFYGEANLIMGDIEFNRRYFDRAIQYFTRSLEFGFNTRETEFIIYYKRGNCYYQMDNLDKAREDLARASELDKKSLKPLLLLSAIQIRQKDYDGALDTLVKADRLEKNNPAVLFQIGSIYYKRNDEKYIQYFDRLFDSVAQDGNGVSDTYVKAFAILADGHYKTGNYARVIVILKAIPESSKNYGMRVTLARALFNTGRYTDASDILEKLSLDNDDDRFMYCQVLASTGRKDRAAAVLQKLLVRDTYRQAARRDPILSPVLKDIEDAEKKRLEEERRRIEEQQRREEERRRIEEERRREEEKRAHEEEQRLENERKAREARERQEREQREKEEAERRSSSPSAPAVPVPANPSNPSPGDAR